MTTEKKNSDHRNIFLGLIIILICISIVQSLFLIKLHRAVDKDTPAQELEKYQGNNLGAGDDFLKRFNLDDWNPHEEFQSMQRHMERMFDDSRNRFKSSPFLDRYDKPFDFLPQTDIEEKKDRFIVKMNIPGADESEIKVDLQDDILTVTAQTKSSTEDRGKDDFLRMERSIGSFHRSFPLPSPVDEGKMETKYEDGVLTIIIPKVGL